MKNKKIIIFILAMSIFAGNFHTASAQNLSALSSYSVKLGISPDHIEEGASNHPIGYIYILNANDVPITSSTDVEILLSSDDPVIASVPEKIILPANAEFATFDITTGILNGDTTIVATLNGRQDFQKIHVGTDETMLPDDVVLELNIPTDEMHVNSNMPFSVFLKTSDGYVIRAPFDIDVFLDYEKSLATPSTDKLTIKKGEYYAWATLDAKQKIGNTFLRAIQPDNQLDTAKSIRISSTLPTSLSIMVFPEVIPAEPDRNVDIFVSVVDSDGNPTIAHEDIPLKLFSNNQNYVGEHLDDTMREEKTVIKKGQFGYYLRQELNLQNLIINDIMIGVSSEGYGVATDTFDTVGETISVDNDKVIDRGVRIFGPPAIPSNATAIISYQMITYENDDDDEESDISDAFNTQNPNTSTDTEEDDHPVIYRLDELDDEEPYPIQANEKYYAKGYVQLLDVVSSDRNLVTIKDPGFIDSSYSFGTAIISSTQKSGDVLVSATIKGVGSDSFLTKVVNTRAQKETRIFSPTGVDNILFDRNGSFDVFLIAIDGKNRPKTLEHDSKFLITPTNGLIEIKKDSTFAFSKLNSDSFTVSDDSKIFLKVTPIGENADLLLSSQKTFSTQPSSKMKILLPNSNLNMNHGSHVGVVQLVDLQDNPIVTEQDIRTKILSSDNKILQTVTDAIIPKGQSYVSFPIKTTGVIGDTMLSASAKGVVVTQTELHASSALTKLKIFTGGLDDEIPVDQQVEIKLYVDDENAESVEGASIKINTDGNSTVTPDVIRTGPDGGATFTLKALSGPITSLEVIATAEGYVDGKESITINVDAPSESALTVANVELPEWIGYIVVIALLLVVVLVVLFLRKSKAPLEEEWEEEEI